MHGGYCTLALKQRSVTKGLCASLSCHAYTLPIRNRQPSFGSRSHLLPWFRIGIDKPISLCLSQHHDKALVHITKTFAQPLISNNALQNGKIVKVPLPHSKTHSLTSKTQQLPYHPTHILLTPPAHPTITPPPTQKCASSSPVPVPPASPPTPSPVSKPVKNINTRPTVPHGSSSKS